MRPVRQQKPLLQIPRKHPLQPMTMARATIGMLFQAPYKEGADGIVGKPRAVNGHRNGSSPASAQPSHRFAHPAPHGDAAHPSHKTLQAVLFCDPPPLPFPPHTPPLPPPAPSF